ncbi:MAG TPA: MoxR family ATPase [Bacillales bacterium]|nr:MoxR family ATPase [Bacillales bacterium]
MRDECLAMLEQYEKRVLGQSMNLRLLAAALLADGHVLIEGVPGTGKTEMARTLAALIGGSFQRIQFTPDLLPSDITGSVIYNMKEGAFQTLKGPVFCNLLLADEINRTPAKTQAALLEAMEEKQVTIQDTTYGLSEVFFVVATQNPIEMEGTYPLPEAQQDRFLFKLRVDFPSLEEEKDVLKHVMENRFAQSAEQAVIDIKTIQAARSEIAKVTLSDDIIDYIMQLVRETRVSDSIQFGASTRAAISIGKGARAWAFLAGRDYVTPDDVKIVAKPALRHRIQPVPHMELEGVFVDEIIEELVGAIPVPR